MSDGAQIDLGEARRLFREIRGVIDGQDHMALVSALQAIVAEIIIRHGQPLEPSLKGLGAFMGDTRRAIEMHFAETSPPALHS